MKIAKLRETVVSYCLGKLDKEKMIKVAEEMGLNGKKLIEFIDWAFREIDEKRWHMILRYHPFSAEALQVYWKVHGPPCSN